MNVCAHEDCKRSPVVGGVFCDGCAEWAALPIRDQLAIPCDCAQRSKQVSNLIVSDSAGRRYRPTGCFREPRAGDFFWSFHNSRVEKFIDMHTGHSTWGFHRIILEPVPVEYEVRVRLTTEEFVGLRLDDGKGCSATAAVKEAIQRGDFEEVSQS